MLNVVMLSVVMLNVVMQSVAAPLSSKLRSEGALSRGLSMGNLSPFALALLLNHGPGPQWLKMAFGISIKIL